MILTDNRGWLLGPIAKSLGAVPVTLSVAPTDPQPAQQPFSYVRQTGATNDSFGTSLALPATPTTAGNHLFVSVRWETQDTLATVTDSAGNVYTALPKAVSTEGARVQWFYCLNAIGSLSNIVTAYWAAQQEYRTVHVLEFSSSGAAYEQQIGASTDVNAGGLITSPVFSTASAGLVLVTIASYNGDLPYASAFSSAYTALGNHSVYAREAFRITTGALTNEVVSYTGSSNSGRAMSVMTLTLPVIVITGYAAIVMVNGVRRQITDAEIGTGLKPLVFVNGVVRQRATTEGIPVIWDGAQFRTLATGETLKL